MNLFGQEFKEYHLKLLIGENASDYLLPWREGKMVRFHWVPCLFNVTWMIYRKMYVEALIFTIIAYLIVIPLAFAAGVLSYSLKIDLSYIPMIWASAFTWVILGFFGKYIYAKYIARKLRKLTVRHGDDVDFEKILLKKGGTTHPLIVFGYIILLASINTLLS